MTSYKQKKVALFNKFSKNLEHLKTYLGIVSFAEGYGSDLYICPLSFKMFTRDGLNSTGDEYLTVEHAPPEALGGRKIALTVNTLNNESGYLLDIKLLNFVQASEFKEGLSPFKTKFKINKKFSISGEISRSQIHFKPTFFHEGAKNILELLKSGEKFTLNFSLTDIKRTDLAFLRIAYILAFGDIGYSFLFGGVDYINSNAHLIREQLQNLNASIISDIPILIEDFPDDFLGSNIIYNPKELRSILVVFDLKTEKKNHRVGVILPGPDAYGFKAYEHWKEAKKKQENVRFDAYTFPIKLDLSKYDDSIMFLMLWKQLNGWVQKQQGQEI